jgi:putative ABC transport system permease protein
LRVQGEDVEVVGVVDDTRASLDPAEAPAAQVYLAYRQDPSLVDARLVVAASEAVDPLLGTLTRESAAVDPLVPITEVGSLADRQRRIFAPLYLAERVLGTTGALALLLCGLGLASVLGLIVAQRRREIAIRAALGAQRAEVVALVLREVGARLAAGLVLGTLLALAAGQALVGLLHGVGPRDPTAVFVGIATLLLVAAVASWWPARRATRIDALSVLRER